MTHHATSPDLSTTLRRVTRRVAPVWPLESFVAVNPYFGMRDEDFSAVAHRLAQVAGARSTMDPSFYVKAYEEGRIEDVDVDAALAASPLRMNKGELLALLRGSPGGSTTAQVPTVADTAAELTGEDWPRLVTDRVSAWASAHFDVGQALWRAPTAHLSPYAAWRAEAEHDRTPEVMGVRRFRASVASLPIEPVEAVAAARRRLQVPADDLDLYLHRLLFRVGGWAGYAARLAFERELRGDDGDQTLVELIAILLSWELALLQTFGGAGLDREWSKARKTLRAMSDHRDMDEGLAREIVMQQAYEHATQRRLAESFASRRPIPSPRRRPRVQAVFCIDVRSEVFRRHLEDAHPDVETLGFAGFFAFPIAYRRLGHDRTGAQCPVLLTPEHEIVEALPDAIATERATARRRLGREVKRAWQAFKMGAISCFSFVGPVGLAYLPKLFTDGFGLTRPVPDPRADGLSADDRRALAPKLEVERCEGRADGGRVTGLPLEARIDLAAGALGAMSLKSNFARLILVTGHGSTNVNNPHKSGLDCGACGGRTGEANARVAAATLNDPAVRRGLAERDIVIPDDTVFVAAQHDTTTDEVTLFGEVPPSHRAELEDVKGWLRRAGHASRLERAERLHLGPGETDVAAAVQSRSRDWAQTRPEWGLAGCSAFVVAPRHRTADLNLGGRSFLHSYAWRQDDGFGVLELIMTAPMIVASWISLQYYASTVDNRIFGAGNKTLHNVVGAVGVLEGNGGDLRAGLPWQSIHDGETFQHEPVRLNVVIEAPIEAMNAIIEKHELLRELLDNGWIHLFAMDDEGRLAHRYEGGLTWSRLDGAREEPVAESDVASAA